MNTDKPDDGSGAKPGDVIYLGSHKYGIIGPPDPSGEGGSIAYTMSADGAVGGGGASFWPSWAGISSSPPAPPSQGSNRVPALRFEIDGWEYSFPSKEVARKLREKLLELTLEGDL